MSALRRLDDFVDELESVPVMTLHGDACSRNLLVRRDGRGFALIDFGFWGEGPVGFDLGQLLVGEVQTGERPATELAAWRTLACRPTSRGWPKKGADVPLAVVRRAHALQTLIFCGLSAVPATTSAPTRRPS
jgi:aminoglycoside phosphotransferase (APT) family kinase protein